MQLLAPATLGTRHGVTILSYCCRVLCRCLGPG
jgi:hypothetical protein